MSIQITTPTVQPSDIPINGLPHKALLNGTIDRVVVTSLASGANEVYTVPAGKRAILVGHVLNPTGGGISTGLALKRGGVIYRLTVTTPGLGNQSGFSSSFVFEAGDIVVIDAASAGLTYMARVYLMDAATCPFKTAFITPLASGNNIIYTVPAGKRAWAFPTGGFAFGVATAGSVLYFNNSGATRNFTAYMVPSGQSVSSLYQVRTFAAIATANSLTGDFQALMLAGDSIVVATDAATATQYAFVTVFEETV